MSFESGNFYTCWNVSCVNVVQHEKDWSLGIYTSKLTKVYMHRIYQYNKGECYIYCTARTAANMSRWDFREGAKYQFTLRLPLFFLIWQSSLLLSALQPDRPHLSRKLAEANADAAEKQANIPKWKISQRLRPKQTYVYQMPPPITRAEWFINYCLDGEKEHHAVNYTGLDFCKCTSCMSHYACSCVRCSLCMGLWCNGDFGKRQQMACTFRGFIISYASRHACIKFKTSTALK